MFDALEKNHLTPAVTLFHFATPNWLWEVKNGKRGWERDDALLHFERFVRVVTKNFGGRARLWCTLNEPMVYVYSGYLDGTFPPFERRGGPEHVISLIEQLLRAHALAYAILKEDAQKRNILIEVGFAHHTRAFEPLRPWHPLDRVVARIIEQAFIWDFSDAVSSGVLTVTNTSYRARNTRPARHPGLPRHQLLRALLREDRHHGAHQVQDPDERPGDPGRRPSQ